jgi:hypothetical protein
MEQSDLSDKIKTDARFTRKTKARKANTSSDGLNASLRSSNMEYYCAFLTCFSAHRTMLVSQETYRI